MKKLMIAAAAVACSVGAFAATNLTSEIVGYNNRSVVKGYNATGASFVAVNGTTADLCDLAITGYESGEYTDGDVLIQMLASDGGIAEGFNFSWVDKAEQGVGWYDNDDLCMVERGTVSLNPGTGILMESKNGYKLQSSGKVGASGVDCTLREGFSLICNPHPTTVNLNHNATDGKFLAAAGFDAESYYGWITIQQLNSSGHLIDGTLLYWDSDSNGWADCDTFEVVETDRYINAAEAIWTEGATTSEKLSFPEITVE